MDDFNYLKLMKEMEKLKKENKRLMWYKAHYFEIIENFQSSIKKINLYIDESLKMKIEYK